MGYYNPIYGIFNEVIIREQMRQQQQFHNAQMIKTFECVHKLEDFLNAVAGQQHIDAHRDDHTHTCVQNAGQGVGDIAFHRLVEKQDAQHHAAGVDSARPVKAGGQDDQQNHTYKQKGQHQRVVTAIGIDLNIQTEKTHSQKAADDGAEQTVAAVEDGVLHILAGAEDGTDAGKGGVAVNQKINQRTEGGS